MRQAAPKQEIHENAPPLEVRGAFSPESINIDKRTVKLEYTAGGRVKRYDWWKGIVYWEELSTEKGHVRLDRANNGAPLLNNHSSYDLDDQIGVLESATETHCLARFAKDEESEKIFQKVVDGIIRNVSVGYIVHKYEEIGFNEEDGLPIWRATDWEVYEVSLVCIPADAGAGVRKRSTNLTSNCIIVRNSEAMEAKEINQREEETAMKPNANGAADENGGANNNLAPAATAAATEEQTRAAAQQGTDAEFTRQADIRAAVRKAGLPDAFADELVTARVTVDAARAQIIDKMAEAQPSQVSRTHISATPGGNDEVVTRRNAIEGAILHRVDPNTNKLDGAAREYRGMRLMDIAREVLGHQNVRGMSPREIATLALGGEVFGKRAAMMTTSDFPEILANVAHKTLRQAYGSTKRSFTPFSRKVYLPDFKDVSRIALSNIPDLDLILEGGEYKTGTFGEGAEKYRLFTYGKKISFSREMMINDDMDALSRIPALFASSAARKESRLVYGILMNNPNMADGNPLFGNTPIDNDVVGPMTIDGIGANAAAMGILTDPSGNDVLNLDIKYQVVPRALELKAKQLKAQTTPNQANQTNPFQDSYEIIVEGLLDANSTTTYYNFADPSQIDTIEYAYLEGEDGPYMESRVGFDVDGIDMKVRHDFASKAIDRRGIQRAVLA